MYERFLSPMRNAAILMITCLLVLSCKNEQAGISGIPFRHADSSKWGIMGTDGRIFIADCFSNPPSAVINDRFTVTDQQGRRQLYAITGTRAPVSPRSFTQIGHFFEEVTLAQEETGSPLVIINKSGETVAELTGYQGYSLLMAHNFSEGLALVYTAARKYGYINTRGEMVIPPSYDMAYDFADGLAIVGLADEEGRMAYQAINTGGETVFRFHMQHTRITGTFSCGRLLCKDLQQNYCCYLDKSGKTVLYLPDKIRECTGFVHDAAVFFTPQGAGLIDKTGKIRIPATYDNGRIAGPQRVAFQSGNKWALFSFEGKSLTDFIYDGISDFYPGGHALAWQDSLFRIIGRQGEMVDTNRYAGAGGDETARRRIPEVFTLHAAAAEEVPSGSPGGEKPEAQACIPRREEEQERGKDNPFYREARKVLSGELPESDANNRRIILDYMEYFRDAYFTRNIGFLEQLFSEDALIIVGKVVKKAPRQGPRYLSSEQVVYNVKSKQEYLTRLKAVFEANKKIQVTFRDFNIRKHPTVPGIYGVTVRQQYFSDLYSDEGYLFLLWDFRDETAPQIHVRTWQPGLSDTNTPLPEQEIFSIRNFNIE